MHLVVAHYNEDLSWLSNIDSTYSIYCKGDSIDLPHIKLENKGRESDTFLRYIVEQYNNLPDVVGFLQGAPLVHDHLLIEKIKAYSGEQVIYLGGAKATITLQKPNWPPDIPLKEVADKLFYPHIDSNKFIEFVYGAQYLVSKEYIENKSYEWWLNTLTVHEEYLNYPGRSCGAPWIFERLWGLIWNYKKI